MVVTSGAAVALKKPRMILENSMSDLFYKRIFLSVILIYGVRIMVCFSSVDEAVVVDTELCEKTV